MRPGVALGLLARVNRGVRSRAAPTLLRRCASAPTWTFSIAVISGNRRMFWNVRARPSLVIW